MPKTGRHPDIAYRMARTAKDFAAVKKLLQEYAGSLYIDLCFQDFDSELETLSTQYRRPDGVLFMACIKGRVIGCVGLRKYDGLVAEIKRMYVQPKHRGRGIGKKLLEVLLTAARKLGYKKIVLDTLPEMNAAQVLYRKYGFKEISEYRFNPVADSVFMAKELP